MWSSTRTEARPGSLVREGFADIEPGIEQTYDINDSVRLVVAGMEDADTDDDRWKCGEAA